jgi:ABC-type nickel/cobalt efflux system permease component RcnA
MVLARKLFAWVLLLIFQLFVLHQTLPHEHHNHGELSDTDRKTQYQTSHTHHHSPENSHHHDERSNDHHHAQNTDQRPEADHHHGLLGYLLGAHIHSDGLSHPPVISSQSLQNQKTKNLGGSLLYMLDVSLGSAYTSSIYKHYLPPGNSDHSYCPYSHHRGPPVII